MWVFCTTKKGVKAGTHYPDQWQSNGLLALRVEGSCFIVTRELVANSPYTKDYNKDYYAIRKTMDIILGYIDATNLWELGFWFYF